MCVTGVRWHPDQTLRLGPARRLLAQAISAGGTQPGARLPSTTTLLAILYCCKTQQGWFHGYQFAKGLGDTSGGHAQPGITDWVLWTVPSVSLARAEWHRSALPLPTRVLWIIWKTSFQPAMPQWSACTNRLHLGCRMKGVLRKDCLMWIKRFSPHATPGTHVERTKRVK